MARHPLENMPDCTCEWVGDDHYPHLETWNPTCPHHKDPNRPKVTVKRVIPCRYCRATGFEERFSRRYFDEPLAAGEEVVV